MSISFIRFSLSVLVVSLPLTSAKSCRTEHGEDGVCISLQSCNALRSILKKSILFTSDRDLIRREMNKCSGEESKGLHCCKRERRQKIPKSYEDVKQSVQINLLPDQAECGGIGLNQMIYNGDEADLDQYPWTVLIKHNDDDNEIFNCGGSLINKRYVLTAAHCIPNIAGVRLGEWDVRSDPDCIIVEGVKRCATPIIDVGIERISIHINYTRRISAGGKIDLALLRLNQDITFGNYVRPICLPAANFDIQPKPNRTMFVAGWGLTEESVKSSRKLYADLKSVDLDECRRLLNAPLIKIDDTIICALGSDGKDSCQGDSGGPLMEASKTELGVFLRGIISKGLSCGSPIPGFYTNVRKQLDWIVSNMEQ
ncbi:serine protease easter-like isoform X2 [Toxorhynchites rutilus septentrionalis]|uniref:serine protease easter-like isoform X2 n=1 Tax=Toxorhynchites rutilus septentrionalis TaxID=329112 RepID=UPI002478C392|nr:serine protease easter-like isoform X2 [Toxorhynchites rutilus septentrionalis]